MVRANCIHRRSILSSIATVIAAAWTWSAAGRSLNAQAAPIEKEPKMPLPSMESLYNSSVAETALTGEAADRLCIRKLIDAWAHYADRRLAEQQAQLFTTDGVVNSYEGDPSSHSPSSTMRGREALVKALAVLNKYSATFHFNGQSEIAVSGDRAIGESYCIAHQLWQEDKKRKLQILAIRYRDRFVRIGDRWFFEERNLIIDWSDTRDSAA